MESQEKYVLEVKSNIPANQVTSFCSQHHENAALILLDRLADGDVINVANSEQRTPLHIAARNGLVPVVQLLLSKGASVTATDNNGR